MTLTLDGLRRVADQSPEHVLWEPTNITTTAILNDGGDLTRGLAVELNNPHTGTAEGSNYVWTDRMNLFPELKAVTQGLDQRRERDIFASGILYVLSATALIALIQEAPKEWRRRRRPKGPGVTGGIDVQALNRALRK